ncbi:WD40-like Beta Propeller Repeat family protein [Mycobacterium kansasii]|uniref:WD40-like Beta Propeller Repeat family protein n=1 Tax=Mycobacterium kansasii TaxID=1768 RepID=A0A1V3WB51_MYCKA|nr:WD40-like Beta Propeller Repeat family protein [Mycobacterium kansasii]
MDAETGHPIGDPLKLNGAEVAFSPDNSRIACGGNNGTIQIWDLNTGRTVGKPLAGHQGPVIALAFSPDGRRIISGSADQTVRVWDAATGQPIGQQTTGGSVLSVAFSPDGTRIASANSDGTIQLWDADATHAVGPAMTGHAGNVYSVAFSPTARGSPPAVRTRRCGCGMPTPVSPSGGHWSATDGRSEPWRSVPTANGSPPAAGIGPSDYGVPNPARSWASP